MRRLATTLLFLGVIVCEASPAKSDDGFTAGTDAADTFSIANNYLQRVFSTSSGHLMTSRIVNKRNGKVLLPLNCQEFQLRLSQGTELAGPDAILTSKDFHFTDFRVCQKGIDVKEIVFDLRSQAHDLTVEVHYELAKTDFYLHKYLVIRSDRDVCLERIDVEALSLADAYQPYRYRAITTRDPANWRPGLGQPLYTTETASFWGVEFPASCNYVEGNQLYCGYLYGRMLKAGQTYRSYAAVVGVSDEGRYNQEAFFECINRIRVRSLRLQMQYNSWFDYGDSVNRERFAGSVRTIHHELCEKRGVNPFRAYVIDDGWQDSKPDSDWSDKVWKVNEKFDSDFKSDFQAVADARSHLGLWLSPQCNFGARKIVPKLREMGWGALDRWMSMADTKYMDMLEARLVELARSGVSYFKLDGIFGHLNTREFDLNGKAHGIPIPDGLDLEGLRTDDERLNDAKYDDLKCYYLTVGTERLIKIFAAMAQANPDVYIVISNGAWLSPWWLQHCDAVWMINASDAARGSSRTNQLTYRDGIYYQLTESERTQFPLCSLFNHEPKKTDEEESPETFRRYLYMSLSRGTGFVELYLKVPMLQEQDWDVLAEGLKWTTEVFPTFARVRMHGGDPQKREVYGFTAWTSERGYVSLHNPGAGSVDYDFVLNRDFGLLPDSGPFGVSSPLEGDLDELNLEYRFGDAVKLTLKPGEIRLLNFTKKRL